MMLPVETAQPRNGRLEKIIASVLAGNCCRVLGPRHRGKSRLLREAAAVLDRQGSHYTSYYSLEDVLQTDQPGFFAGLYEMIAQDFSRFTGEAPEEGEEIETSFQFQFALTNLLQPGSRNYVLFLDDLELAPPNLIASLLGVLRAVFNTFITRPGARFQAVVCGSLSFNQLALDGASRFESISDLVMVGDLDERERQGLLDRLLAGAQAEACPEGAQAFFACTGGEEYLIQRFAACCLEALDPAGPRVITQQVVERAAAAFLQQPLSPEVEEALSQIESDPNLLSCTVQILERGEVPGAELPLPSLVIPTLLDLCGVFVQRDNRYAIKSELWAQILRRHFHPVHVGRLYAIAGYWPEAIQYYGLPSEASQIDKKSDVFAATINAMYASRDGAQAFRYLAQGLQAVYPGCAIRLYVRTEPSLVLVSGAPDDSSPAEIRLNEANRPEVEALRGPDYSIATIGEEPHYLIPLRPGSGRSAVGLASFCANFSAGAPNKRREEILQLIRFLHQATRAAEARNSFDRLLKDAKNGADTQHNLSKILTHILNHPELPEEVILRLVLAGVTSGWGLKFNRACFFRFDEGGNRLRARLGVGHLTREEADWDWRHFPHQTLDELIASLMYADYRYTSLHRAVKDVSISLRGAGKDLLSQAYLDSERKISNSLLPLNGLPAPLIQAIQPPVEFALVPFQAGSHGIGIVYVDDKFTQQSITDVRILSLQGFLNQAALVMELVQALNAEKRRANAMSHLMQIEELVNERITQSVGELLEEIARSAHRLTGADCTVVHSLFPAFDPHLLETDHFAVCGTRTPVPGDKKIRSTGPLTAQVIRDGLLPVADVRAAPPLSGGSRIEDSAFIRSEGVESFVAVRLGPRENPAGILYVNWWSAHTISDEELTILTLFANYAAVAIPSARRYQQVQDDLHRRTQELEALTALLHASLELRSEGSRSDEEILKLIHHALQSIREFVYLPQLHLFCKQPRGGFRRFELTPTGELVTTDFPELDSPIVRDAFQAGEPVRVNTRLSGPEFRLGDGAPSPPCSALALPIKKAGNCLDVLYLESSDPSGIPANFQEFLAHLGDRLALTFHQAEIYSVLRRLLDVALLLSPDTSLEQVMQFLVENAMDSLRAVDAITVYYVERQTRRLLFGYQTGVWDIDPVRKTSPLPGNRIERVLQEGQPVFADRVVESPILYGPFVEREKVCSVAALPLLIGEDAVGCIFFNYRSSHHFDDGEKNLLKFFAQLATIAIHRAGLQVELGRRRQRLETVARITPIISQAGLDLDDVFRAVLRETLGAIPIADNACIVEMKRFSTAGPGMYALQIRPPGNEFYKADLPLEQGGYRVGPVSRAGIASRVIQNSRSEIVPRVSDDPDYLPAISSTQSELCVPIMSNGKASAAIVFESDTPDAFSLDDQLLVENLANHVAIAMRNAEQFRLDSERRARERMATMATGLIHDINKIIANIPDVVQELKEGLEYGEKLEEIGDYLYDLENYADEAQKISRFLRDFVVMGKFNPVSSHLQPVIQGVVDKMRSGLPQLISIECSLLPDLPPVLIDELWIDKLLENLLSNAQDAIRPGEQGRISISTSYGPKNVYITIQDNGVGIPEDRRRIIFEPGFSTKNDANKMHGIGLFHCNQIVDAHQGDIHVESQEGLGSIFTIRLPRDPHRIQEA